MGKTSIQMIKKRKKNSIEFEKRQMHNIRIHKYEHTLLYWACD